jgi:triacylglycerol esterase/lipase EstA (alpha/beta hydrolase family)
MLARLLRGVYLFQLLSGALLGTWLAVSHTQNNASALLLVPLCTLGLPLLLQFLVICISMLRSRLPGQGVLWWQAFWGELRAALTVYLLRQPWAGKNPGVLQPTQNPAGPAKLPVLLVHGYICNHRVWDNVADALRQAGHPVLAVDLEPLFTSIDDYAVNLEQATTTLLTATGATQIALVGHSMGGLVIRAWLRASGQARVARVITLGSPHQGTDIARASMTSNGSQMIWRSDWLQTLQSSETPAVRRLLHIALTLQDNIVYPQREQVLEGAAVTEFSGIGHVQMCLSPMVIGWLVQQLDAA